MKREDIRLKTDEEKEAIYLRINTLWQMGLPVSIQEHRSGFPAVTVDIGDEHIITDILSVEQWWANLPAEMKQHERGCSSE